ncbi:hypothetical protein [Pedobacter terrae]|uniref:hypothetical protein n=1 Tax=Pedobacter terrae TaxID=405671 RepID=UPI002FFA30C4
MLAKVLDGNGVVDKDWFRESKDSEGGNSGFGEMNKILLRRKDQNTRSAIISDIIQLEEGRLFISALMGYRMVKWGGIIDLLLQITISQIAIN